MAALTEYSIEAAKTKDKEYTLKDGEGLFLNIYPNGSKYWLIRFSWNSKHTRLLFGTYPKIDIKKARFLCKQANYQRTTPRLTWILYRYHIVGTTAILL